MTAKALQALFCSLLICQIFLFSGCVSNRTGTNRSPKLKTISIIDRNGMAETISNSERINQYQCVDFLKPQPYQKVLRIYSRDNYGNIHAFINSYHENGQPKQYLKVVNSRAFGDYREWHDNGVLKLQAYVVGGEADIAPSAEATWLFDGNSSVWDKEGTLIANICYEKGKLQGDSLYYHPNGNVWKRIPYNNDEIDGTYEIYLENRQLLQCTEYRKGSKHGPSFHYWSQNQLASREEYQNGSLLFGLYYDPAGQLVSEINDGHGKRAVFGKTTITELQEFRHGIPEGEIRVFGSDQKLLRKYHIKNNQKHGEEVEYYEFPHLRHLPKLSISWYEGKIQGLVKTWYDNGVQESKKEMSNNTKNGILTAWYRDGYLMLIEEYDHDKLVKGEYYRKGEKHPVSLVKDGKGVMTSFDPEGNFVRKIQYDHGVPTGTG